MIEALPGDLFGTNAVFFVNSQGQGKTEVLLNRRAGQGDVSGCGTVARFKLRAVESGTISISTGAIEAYDGRGQAIALIGTTSSVRVHKVTLKPVPRSSLIAPGTEFEVDINTDVPVNNLLGISFDLQYDQSKVELLGIESGFLGTDTIMMHERTDNDMLSICITRKASGVTGYGSVARMRFRFSPLIKAGEEILFGCTNIIAASIDATVGITAGEKATITVSGNKTIAYVWPGDTNNDGVVNQFDVISIAIYWQQQGCLRANANISWDAGQYAQSWGIAVSRYPDAVYADADGNGIVNAKDVLAIGLNWGKTRSLKLAAPNMVNAGIDHALYVERYQSMLALLPDTPEMSELRNALAGLIALGKAVANEYNVYPNPYYPTTLHAGVAGITFQRLDSTGEWKVKVYTIAGELVAECAGEGNTLVWKAADCASGVYLYVITNGNMKKAGKVAIIR